MLSKTHIIGAVATGAATGAAMGLPLTHTAAMAGAASLTAKLPDLDRLANKGPNHRSLTHSVVFAGGGVLALAYYLCSLLPATLLGFGYIVPVVVWGLAIGYASHLLLDSFTCKKVPLLFPKGMMFGLGVISTGKPAENVFLGAMMLSAGVFVAMSYGNIAGIEGGGLFGGMPSPSDILSGIAALV